MAPNMPDSQSIVRRRNVPETGGCGGNDQQGHHQNQSNGLQADHRHQDHQGHHQEIKTDHRPSLGHAVIGVETDKREFLEKEEAYDGGHQGRDGNEQGIGKKHGGGFAVDERRQSGSIACIHAGGHAHEGNAQAEINTQDNAQRRIILEP
jgi:hypothetical protein